MIFHKSTYRPDATVILYGGKDGDPTPYAKRYTRSRDRTIDYTILPPSDYRGEGFKQIVTVPTGPIIHADGLLLPPGKTATIRSKDCPIGFIKNRTTGWGVLWHSGRAATSPDQNGWNIVTAALFAVKRSEDDDLSAYILASICKKCFVHNMCTDMHLIAPFLLQYPHAVHSHTGGIDLVGIIRNQLGHAKVQEIEHDGLCTYEHYGLSSHRRKDPVSNMVLVLNH